VVLGNKRSRSNESILVLGCLVIVRGESRKHFRFRAEREAVPLLRLAPTARRIQKGDVPRPNFAQRNMLPAGRPAAQSLFVRRSFHPSKAAGKAVRIGHSCAAVTHHKLPPRGELARVQPIGSQPVKAEVRRPRCARQIPKSKGPNAKVGGAIAPARLGIWPLVFGVCAQGAPQMRSPKIRPWVLTRRARFLRAPFAKTSSQK